MCLPTPFRPKYKTMEQELKKLEQDAKEALEQQATKDDLEKFRITYLGRKGRFSSIMKHLGQVRKEERPRLGQLANQIKQEVESLFAQKIDHLEKDTKGECAPPQDLTLPGRRQNCGSLHPVTQVMEEICAVFEKMGFAIAEGPDVETDHYNFTALNIPAHHPARDMHDTFYLSESTLLRTHTSPMQARMMEKQSPPLRLIAPGK
ncbi:unnamed protein product, partial [Cyprideis torosa]